MKQDRSTLRHKSSAVFVVIGLLCLSLLIGTITIRDGGSRTKASGTVAVDSIISVNGVEMRLGTISQTLSGIEMSFSLALPANVASSDEENVLGPIFVGDQLRLENITLPQSGLTIRVKPHVPGETSQKFVLLFDKVQQRDAPVVVEFVEIPLQDDDDGTLVQGPWRFVIPPRYLPVDPVQTVVDLDQVVTDGQMAVTVSRIEILDDSIRAYYEIATTTGAPFSLIGDGVRLRSADGDTAFPLLTERIGQPQVKADAEDSARFVAVFGRSEKTSKQLILEFGPFFVGNAQPATIVVRQPLDQASADAVIVANERFGLADVSYSQEDERLTVTIANLESGHDAQAVFLGPAAPTVEARDGQGRTYTIESAGTGMKRLDDGTMRAGDSTFTIVGPIPPSVQTLSITVEQSGLLRRDLLVMKIALPSALSQE